ncbi:amino acid permease [Fructobacillus sp. M1-13]|uniref:Amino acid permease n=1 Tax=Fructobacillus papyriferae TaxID=2713171 RepID=A0ABS5QR33_9LACO|nr:amino acid permease [Fructobacillus papyriferae]MCD2159049.1 amino acid permease [Fructobacillus papyriferae]
MASEAKKLGTIGLIGLIVPAMIGGGAYDLPENMAANAGLIGQALGWIVSGLIIWCLVYSFLFLSKLRPDFTSGLYKYAEDGFGKFTGFFVSWGYWICECFANITYAVLLASTLNAFFPGVFKGGNNLNSILLGTVILWSMSALVLKGIQGASWVDNLSTAVILLSLLFFIVSMIAVFNPHTFTTNIWANQAMTSLGDADMGSIFHQVKSTMMVTLWVFGGVEGAVVLSGNARSQKDVRNATKWGFIICLIIYAAVSILALGYRSYGQIGKMASPSTGALLASIYGPIGHVIIGISVLVAVLASWLTWTLMLSEMPRAAAQMGTFPTSFKKMNKNHMPAYSIIVSTIVMQLILFSTHFAGKAFNTMLTIVGTMTVPPYLIAMLYLFKISLNDKEFNPTGAKITFGRTKPLIYSGLAILGTLYMGYSAGITYTALSFVIYALGIPVYIWARTHKQDMTIGQVFGKYEKIFVACILIVAVGSCAMMLLK